MPLWPAGLLYLQMLAEPRSRVDACAPRTAAEAAELDVEGQAALLGFPRAEWRKNTQWWVGAGVGAGAGVEIGWVRGQGGQSGCG